jgi:NAD+ kinase
LKKSVDRIRCVGLIANPEKVSGPSVVRRAAALIAATGRSVLTEPPTARVTGLTIPQCPSVASLARHCDLLLVFGGDGTMLRVTRDIAGLKPPILGIKVGGLGFLTAVSSSRLPLALQKVWAGEFRVETRPLIEAIGSAQGKPVTQLALNDFVISRGTVSRMIELEVRVDGEVLICYRCDGLIISSPTGSTAYSLAAGGAIVSPNADVFAVTPICPHTLSNRSVIVSLGSTVQVRPVSKKLETLLTADGQVQTALSAGDVVAFRRSARSVRLLRLDGGSFFETLRQKLHWSGSTV